MRNINAEDLKYLAATLWGEARGEGAAGMLAVANVIYNRAAHPNRKLFGGPTVKGVVLKPWQFSCWNANDPNRKLLVRIVDENQEPKPTTKDGVAYMQAKQIAAGVLMGTVPDPTAGALYYHSKLVTPRDWNFDLLEWVGIIGNHVFYRDKVLAPQRNKQ